MSPPLLARRHAASTRRRSQALRAFDWFFGVQLYLAAWFWAIALVCVTITLLLVHNLGEVQLSIFQFVQHGGLWFPFSIAIIAATAQLTLHVTSGMTRRSFIRGALLAAVATGILMGVTTSAGLVTEGWLYAANDWPHTVETEGAEPALRAGFWPMLLGLCLVYTSGTLSGLLVGVTYYRTGGWWGTIALPLSLSPILLVNLVSASSWAPFGFTFDLSAPGATLAALAVLTAAAAAFHRLTRRVPIAPVEA